MLEIGSIPQGGISSFVQQGQVDWVAFGNTIWSTSSAVLQRFASAGVQPITFGAGLALATQFELDRLGKQRMHDALNDLQGSRGFDKLLWFGFGVRSFVRVMGETQLGVNCIALCSCLTEVHGVDVSAWVLEELWNLHGYPKSYLPSHAQFLALVRACSGALTRSSFGLTTDRMAGEMIDGSRADAHEISNVKDIAKAIQGLFHISTGKVSRITVTGGQECAFIAAFAQWLFNFKVHVEDQAGAAVYSNTTRETAQVTVIYAEASVNSLLHVSSTTYVLRDLDELFIRNPTFEQIRLTIRTPWDGCLARVFGAAFNDLINLPYVLGGFLGTVARIYSSLATGGADVSNISRDTYVNFVEASYGQGFVNSAISIFPELGSSSTLLEEMRRAADSSIEDALRTLEQTLRSLAHLCKCSNCTPHGIQTEKFCLPSMAISIRTMISTISCTARDPQLLPVVRGIQSFYFSARLDVSIGIKFQRENLPSLSIALGLNLATMFGEESYRYRKLDILSHAVELFSGVSHHNRYFTENPERDSDICTAIVRQGVCYYFDCLRSISSQAETVRTVHILPGHIQMEDRHFDTIFDGTPNTSDLAAVQYNTINESYSDSIALEPRPENIKIKAFALESSAERQLILYYEISILREPTLVLRPGRLTYGILERTGLIVCEQTHCTQHLAFPCAHIDQGWQVAPVQFSALQSISNTGFGCCIWPPMSEIARCIVIFQHTTGMSQGLFLRQRECLSCSTVSVAREHSRQKNQVYHII